LLPAHCDVEEVGAGYPALTLRGRGRAQVAALHPAHTAASVAAALPRLHYYEEGSCAVHHMFGAQVTERVRAAHGDALLTAHFEVRARSRAGRGGRSVQCCAGLGVVSRRGLGAPLACVRRMRLWNVSAWSLRTLIPINTGLLAWQHRVTPCCLFCSRARST